MDPRVTKRWRQQAATGPLRSGLEGAIHDIAAAFKKTSGFHHAQTKGNEREEPVRTLFRENLPKAFGVVSGEIVDLSGKHSRQTDLIIYNQNTNPAFYSGGAHMLPAEAPLVTMEIKTTLNASELASIAVAATQLRSLRPLGRYLEGARTEGQPAEDRFRYFHCVFAYNTDLSADNWAKNEYRRIVEASQRENLSLDAIDRVYVADRGLIIPSKAIALDETPQSGTALMHFILHAVNFCLREDRRRPRVEYVNYADTSTKAWKKLD